MKKLYHFTPVANIESIKRDGIKPLCTAEAERMLGVGGTGCVFLCNTPSTAIDGRELAMIQRRNPDLKIVSKRWMHFDDAEPLARITISIPADYIPPAARGDDYYGLKRYGSWLLERRKQYPTMKLPGANDPLMKRAMTTWWIGIETRITPEMIRAIDIEDAVLIEKPKGRKKQ